MMSPIRGLRRHLAALLLIASPAVGGQLMPLVHPCPVEAPWASEQGPESPAHAHLHAGHAGSAVPDAPTPSEHHGHAECTCIGACAAPVALESPTASVPARTAFATPGIAARWFPVALTDGPGRPHDRLPPQTAPPLA